MCARKLVVLNRICLGAREICYEAYSLPKGEVVEVTGKQLRDYLKAGTDEVYGLELSKTGELVLSPSFYTTNMMNKVHTGTLTPMVDGEAPANLFYIVIGTHKEKNETMYDVVSSRFQRTSFTAEKVRALLDMQIISGGCCVNEKGEIVVAELEKPEPSKEAEAPKEGKKLKETKQPKPVETPKATEAPKEEKKLKEAEQTKPVETPKEALKEEKKLKEAEAAKPVKQTAKKEAVKESGKAE